MGKIEYTKHKITYDVDKDILNSGINNSCGVIKENEERLNTYFVVWIRIVKFGTDGIFLLLPLEVPSPLRSLITFEAIFIFDTAAPNN